MKILSEKMKIRMARNRAICEEYRSLIADGTKKFTAKAYLAKKFGISVNTVHAIVKVKQS